MFATGRDAELPFADEPILGPGLVEAFDLDGDERVIPRLRADAIVSPRERARARLPRRASGEVSLRDEPSGLEIAFSLEGARDVALEHDGGLAIYRSATADGGDVGHRVRGDGTEDLLLLASRPAREELRYQVDVRRVAGIRHVANVVEQLSGQGTIALRVATPFVVDAAGETHEALLRVEGCATIEDPSPRAMRTPPAPGADRCTISVSWSTADRPECASRACGELPYPVVVDPTWSTATSMASPRRLFATSTYIADAFNGDVYPIVIGGLNGTACLSGVEAYDVSSKKWIAEASLHEARYAETVTTLADGSLLVAGGVKVNGTPETATSTAEVMPLSASTGSHAPPWVYTDSMLSIRAYHTADKLFGNVILMEGGFSNTKLVEWWHRPR